MKGKPHAELGEMLNEQHEMITNLLRQQASLVERRKAIVTEKTAKFKNKNRNNREVKMYVTGNEVNAHLLLILILDIYSFNIS